MITIQHQWGADYLVFNQPLHLDPIPLTSPEGITLQPGQSLRGIGSKRRSGFRLIAGHSMTYQGLLTLDAIRYAIFHCLAHDAPQIDLFGNQLQYRYAFACVFVKGDFICFLVGPGGPAGMADIRLDFIYC